MSKNNKSDLKIENIDITVDGSLGLLALGARGVKAWRERREEEGYVIKNSNKVKKKKKENAAEEKTDE